MKQFKILTLATVVFAVCIVIAYHNTASLGYGREHLIYYDFEGVEVMGVRVEYQYIKDKINYFKDLMPDDYVAI
ncbi:MAG: hypothetical protein IJR60_06750 [Eubacterium sp.]|nr:hypothetical protein [Eubacterium sp.]